MNNNYRYALSITSQFYFCGLPLRLDSCSMCTIQCPYCFAASRGGNRAAKRMYANIVDFGMILNRSENLTNHIGSSLTNMLEHRIPIHLGGICDPFSDKSVISVTCELLKILVKHNYPVVLSTKNTSPLLSPGVISLLKQKNNVVIQVSFSTSSDQKALIMEPNAPLPQKRINDIRRLTENGIYTIARIQPLFPQLLEEIINDLIPELGDAGVRHTVVEFLKLPFENRESVVDMFNKLNWGDPKILFKELGAEPIGREWVLPNKFKWDSLQQVINAIKENGMTFSTGDYGLNHLGDTACCCGIDGIPGFSNWFSGNFANVVRNEGEEIYFSDVTKYWIPDKSIKMYLNSNSRNGSVTMLDFLKYRWNKPGTVNSPDIFLGISFNGKIDNDGNCIYIKDVNGGL